MSNIQLVHNLLRLLKAHRYTQQQISDMLNISRQAYSNYETSKRTPDLDSLIRLSQIYGVTLDDLVNQSCHKEGVINERRGPYTPAMEIESADTIYLTKEESLVIQHYREAGADDRRLVKKVLNVTEEG